MVRTIACPDADEVLDYLARRLEVEDHGAIEAHVDACEACRLLLAELARTASVEELVPKDTSAAIERVGRYVVLERIGSGGMGAVYGAHDPELDRRVAIKLVHPELASGASAERMIREGRALAKLSHPHVVGVYDAGTDGGRVYVAMELVDGEDITAWLRGAPRRWQEIAARFVEVGRGLAAAHAAGVVHRDVKPENVLVDREGRARVVDFGLASALLLPEDEASLATGDCGVMPGPLRSPRLTRPGALLGTPAFMSPEQRRRGAVGPATDQYSLCASLAWSLAIGAPAARIPGWLRSAIARGMAEDPAARFPSIEALAAALDPEAHARRRRRIAGGLGAAAVLVLTAVGAVALSGGEQSLAERIAQACDAAEPSPGWTPDDRAAVEGAIRAAGGGPELWDRVDAAVVVYQGELDDAHTELCAVRPITAEQRENVSDGLDCLAARHAALDAVTGRLRTVDEAGLGSAVLWIHALERPEGCANPAVLVAERRLRAQPDGARTREALTTAMAAVADARVRGDDRAVLEHATQAVALARPIGGYFLARALLLRGEASTSMEGFAAAEASYREAATLAETEHHDELRALALASLLQVVAREPGREREALALRPLVEAAVERAGSSDSLGAMIDQACGTAQLRLGDVAAAIASFEASLAAARRALPRSDPRMPAYLHPLGLALGTTGRDREALAMHEEAVEVATTVWGADAPNTARYAINAAAARARLGDCERAITELTAARGVLVGVLPDASPEHLTISEVIGSCELALGRLDAATHEHQARHAALAAAGQARSMAYATAWIDLGDVHAARHDTAAARDAYERALALYEELVGTTDARLGLPLIRIGESHLAEHQPRIALAPLERALVVMTTAGVTAMMLAEVQFPLARALWAVGGADDRARARELATAAHTAYVRGSELHAGRARTVAAWLADPGEP